jgi:hypothetical protein
MNAKHSLVVQLQVDGRTAAAASLVLLLAESSHACWAATPCSTAATGNDASRVLLLLLLLLLPLLPSLLQLLLLVLFAG